MENRKYRLEVTEMILKTSEELEKEREEGRKSRPYQPYEVEVERYENQYRTERVVMITLNYDEMERVKEAVLKEI